MPEETLKQVVDRVKAAKTAIGNAIVAKGGTVGANDGLEEYPADIATIPSGGIEPASPKDVNFYDYDGTCVYSYTADEFAELTEMPANPTHTGLTAQGWNWSLSDAKDYVADYGKLNVGQIYITDDGKTRIYITLDVPERLSPTLSIGLNGTAVIDWGDRSPTTTLTGTNLAIQKSATHNYNTVGNYIISINVTSGEFAFIADSSASYLLREQNFASSNFTYLSAINKIEIGNNITAIRNYSFINCRRLQYITIPKNIISIGNGFATTCVNLLFCVLPNTITSIGTYSFQGCVNLRNVVLSNEINTIGIYCFQNCYRLLYSTLPINITVLQAGTFYQCKELLFVLNPIGVTEIKAEAFYGCIDLDYIKFKQTTPPTIANINAWSSISLNCYIMVPLNTLDDYLNETNMPDDSRYLYLCYAKYASGAELPTTSTDGYTLTWYATKDDARAGTNPITVGNGKEVYAVGV